MLENRGCRTLFDYFFFFFTSQGRSRLEKTWCSPTYTGLKTQTGHCPSWLSISLENQYRFCIQTAWSSAVKKPNCPTQWLQARVRQAVLRPLWWSPEVPREQRSNCLTAGLLLATFTLHWRPQVSLSLTLTHRLSFPDFAPYLICLLFCQKNFSSSDHPPCNSSHVSTLIHREGRWIDK